MFALAESPARPLQQIAPDVPDSDANLLASPGGVPAESSANMPWWPVLLAAAVILIPAFLVVAYVVYFGVNVPFWDDWALAPYLTLAQTHQLTAAALFAQHNEERIFFPRLVMMAIAAVTNWNLTGQMFAYALSLILVCLLLFLVYVRETGVSARSLLFFAPAAFLIFSLRQWENLLWGFEIVWGVLALFAILALYLLQLARRPWIGFVLAALSGIVASYSGLIGMLVWPVGAAQIAYTAHYGAARKWRWLMIALWLGIGVGVAALYAQGYVKPPQTPNPLAPLRDPLDAGVFYLSLLGAAFTPNSTGATIIGLLAVCAFVYALVLQAHFSDRRVGGFLLAVVLFWFAADAVITFGRMGFGMDQSLVPRYTVFALIGSAALYLWWVLAWKLYQRSSIAGIRVETLLVASVFVLISAGVFAGFVSGITAGAATHAEREQLVDVALNYNNEPDSEVTRLFPDPAFVRAQLEFIERQRLSVFAGNR
jgi:hypothetical protein